MNLTAIDYDNFNQELLEATGLTLVDFYADWCGPCQALTPIVRGLESEYGDSLKVRKIDVDEEPELAAQFQIRSIPTLMLFKDGEHKETIIGAQPRVALKSVIDRYLDEL